MSLEYDEYLREHIKNVQNGLRWLIDNLDLGKLGIDAAAIDFAIKSCSEHDSSKILPEEYFAYDKYFYGKNRSHGVVKSFDYAWLHHQNHNQHHWQYWVLINDDEGVNRALEMPFSCVLEMIADWWSFSWKSGNLEEIFDWYESHKNKLLLHVKTRKLVEDILEAMKEKLVIEHHGRKGQKWGVMNGPPYPFDQETVKKAYGGEKSSQSVPERKRSSWADKLDREVEDLKEKLKTADPDQQEELRQKIHDMQEDADARYRMAKFNEPEGPDKDLPDISEERLKEHPIESLSDLKKLDKDADMAKVRKNINHPDGEDDAGRHYNCPNCAAAFELTERGYDVIARPKPNGSNVENVEDFFKGGKLTNVYPHGIFNPPETDSKKENYRAMSELEKAHDEAAHSALTQMKNQGEGARGIIVVGWMWSDPKDWKYRTTSYHAMNYKVVNENGNAKVRIFDTQSKRPGNQNGERWYSFLYEADPRDIYIMRTDNLELDDLITTAVYSNKKG